MRQLACKISQKLVEPLLRYSNILFFQDGGRPPFGICVTNFRTTHNENLVVFITIVCKSWLESH